MQYAFCVIIRTIFSYGELGDSVYVRQQKWGRRFFLSSAT